MTRAILSGVLALAISPALVDAGASPKAVAKTGSVQGFKSVTYKINFAAKAPATIRLTGDGDTQLSLTVLDSGGRRVAADTRAGDVLNVRFTPKAAGAYSVRVSNHGGVPNRFSLRTN